jgi:membrane associated rhomboid family serine protease
LNQFYAPTLTKLNKILLISVATGFICASILRAVGAFSLADIFGISSHGIFNGHIYQLLTYPLIETNLMSVLFNSLVVWFIGSELEAHWGEKIYLRFILLNVVGVGLVYALVNLIFFFGTSFYFASLHGLSGINFALLIAYSMIFPDRQMAFMMIFPMKAKVFCWLLAGIEAYLAVFNTLSTSWAHLISMGISFLIIHFQTSTLVRKALHTGIKSKNQGKKHLYVVKGDDQKPPKYWQ